MSITHSLLIITVKGDTKYKIGVNKDVTVAKVLKDIKTSKGKFYTPIESCAINIEEIVSVETMIYQEEGTKQ